jgi:predicted aspartyl protease
VVITFLKIEVSDPEHPKKKKECEFLFDSGTVYSLVPTDVSKTLGIKPSSSEESILTNGEVVKRTVGNTYFEYQGKVRGAPSVFGDKGILT